MGDKDPKGGTHETCVRPDSAVCRASAVGPAGDRRVLARHGGKNGEIHGDLRQVQRQPAEYKVVSVYKGTTPTR